MINVVEETTTTFSYAPGQAALSAYLDAKRRSDTAFKLHENLFDTDAHVDRIVAVNEILHKFFGRYPDYHTYRGIGRKPFESVKMCDVGRVLNSRTRVDKDTNLYGPLDALGNIEIRSKNGHLVIHVKV